MEIKISLKIDNEEFGKEVLRYLKNVLREYIGEEIQGTITLEERYSEKLDYPVCPHCGEKITHLEQEEDAILVWKYFPTGDYSTLPDLEASKIIGDVYQWVCPKCGKIITQSEEDAYEFLNS